MAAPKLPLALGTVQLGLPYGAANTKGMPTEEEAIEIVLFAIKAGITALDTAHGYGLSQKRLGIALVAASQAELPMPSIITKCDPAIGKCGSAQAVIDAVDGSIATARSDLGTPVLDTVCLHYWGEHGPSLFGGAALERLKHHMAEGSIRQVGTSTYTPKEVLEALEDPAVTHIQLPFNVLDHRWRTAGVPEALLRRPDVTVHARSCLLQGILVSEAARWPAKFGWDVAHDVIGALETLAAACGKRSRLELCVAYVLAQPWISALLVGVETLEQLQENVGLAQAGALTPEQVELVHRGLPAIPEDLLNPGKWGVKPSFAGSFNRGLLGSPADLDVGGDPHARE